MKKVFLFLVIVITIIGCTNPKQPTAKGTLTALLTKYRNHKSISYWVDLKMKYFGRNDTTDRSAPCKLIRDAKDTIFNGYVWFYSKWGNYLYYRYYDLDSIYIVDDSLKNITIYNDPKRQYWAIKGNVASEIMNTLFLDTSTITDILKDSNISKTFSLEKLGNNEYWKISVKYPDNSELKDKRRYIWINPKDTTLKRMVSQRKFQNKESFKEWDLDSIVFDKVTPDGLKALMKGKFATYKVKSYVPPNPELEKPLANGLKAPDFSGINFATGKKESLSDYKGRIVLLDFWYMDCIWCVRAMPTIEKIRDKFTSKGLVVLGINKFDSSAEQQKKLPEFIKINKNTYPTVLVSRTMDKLYNVNSYPTFYLINKKGDIVFSEIGYSPKLDSTLSAQINKISKK